MMRLKFNISLLCVLIAIMFSLSMPRFGFAQTATSISRGDVNTFAQITDLPRTAIDSYIKQQMRKSDADPERGRYRFLIGFSTGHFAADPVHALALRRVAFGLVNNTLTAGDQVGAFAWEMHVWNPPLVVTLSENPADRESFVNAVPYTPAQKSVGGHDAEQTITEVLEALLPADAPHTVLLLLTNDGQSQIGAGTQSKLLGQNNPHYLQTLERQGFRQPERESFTVHTVSGDRVLHLIGVFPRRLTPLPGATATLNRYPTFALSSWRPIGDCPENVASLPNPVAIAKSPTSASGKIEHKSIPPFKEQFPWLWVVTVLGVLGLAAGAGFWLTRRASPMSTAPATASNPKNETAPLVPGRLVVSLGAGTPEQTLAGFRTSAQWHIALLPQSSDATLVAAKSLDEKRLDEPGAVVLATLSLEPKAPYRLVIATKDQRTFTDVVKKDVDTSDSLRRIVPPDATYVGKLWKGAQLVLSFTIKYERTSKGTV